MESYEQNKNFDVSKDTNYPTTIQTLPTLPTATHDMDIFPELVRESSCESTSSRISSVVSASKAARRLKQQRTMSRDRSEDTKH